MTHLKQQQLVRFLLVLNWTIYDFYYIHGPTEAQCPFSTAWNLLYKQQHLTRFISFAEFCLRLTSEQNMMAVLSKRRHATKQQKYIKKITRTHIQ